MRSHDRKDEMPALLTNIPSTIGNAGGADRSPFSQHRNKAFARRSGLFLRFSRSAGQRPPPDVESAFYKELRRAVKDGLAGHSDAVANKCPAEARSLMRRNRVFSETAHPIRSSVTVTRSANGIFVDGKFERKRAGDTVKAALGFAGSRHVEGQPSSFSAPVRLWDRQKKRPITQRAPRRRARGTKRRWRGSGVPPTWDCAGPSPERPRPGRRPKRRPRSQ